MRFFEVDSAVDAIMSAAMLAQTRASSSGKQGKLSMNGFLQMLANSGIMMDYDGFKTLYDTNPQLANVIAQFNKDEITFVGDSDDEDAEFEPAQGEMPDDERVAKMAKSAMKTREFVEGYEVLPKMDRKKYQERDGLEGPIMTRSGKVVYHDNKEGKYYDPDTDMYLSYDDYKMLDKKANEAELPPHLSKMFGKDGSQVETRTDVMKQMRDIVDNKQAMNVTFGDGKQMVDMYTASTLVQIYDKVNDANKEKIVQRVGTTEKFMKLMPKLFGMMGEGIEEGFASDAQRKAAFASGYDPSKKKKKTETKTKNIDYGRMISGKGPKPKPIRENMEDKIAADIAAGMGTDAIIGKYANKATTNTDEIRKMIQRIKFKNFRNK